MKKPSPKKSTKLMPYPELDEAMRRTAELTARTLISYEDQGNRVLPASSILGKSIHLLARVHVDLLERLGALASLVDLTDPADPVGTAMTRAGLTQVQPPEDIYDLLSRAFATSREDAKQRFLTACYGGTPAPVEKTP